MLRKESKIIIERMVNAVANQIRLGYKGKISVLRGMATFEGGSMAPTRIDLANAEEVAFLKSYASERGLRI